MALVSYKNRSTLPQKAIVLIDDLKTEIEAVAARNAPAHVRHVYRLVSGTKHFVGHAY
jgi:hypothetical protein